MNSEQFTENMEEKGFKFDFEKLKVYQKALDFIHEIFKIYKRLPLEFKYTIGGNMVRAGASTANNIAEGSGKKSKKEKSRYAYQRQGNNKYALSIARNAGIILRAVKLTL